MNRWPNLDESEAIGRIMLPQSILRSSCYGRNLYYLLSWISHTLGTAYHHQPYVTKPIIPLSLTSLPWCTCHSPHSHPSSFLAWRSRHSHQADFLACHSPHQAAFLTYHSPHSLQVATLCLRPPLLHGHSSSAQSNDHMLIS